MLKIELKNREAFFLERLLCSIFLLHPEVFDIVEFSQERVDVLSAFYERLRDSLYPTPDKTSAQ